MVKIKGNQKQADWAWAWKKRRGGLETWPKCSHSSGAGTRHIKCACLCTLFLYCEQIEGG